MKCGFLFRRLLLLAAVAAGVLAGSSLAHGAATSAAAQARQLGAGCEPNRLPNSLAVCEGTGRLNVRLKGTAVLSVQSGRVTLKGRAERVCRMKRVKRKNGRTVIRRVCSKRAKPILPQNVESRKARGYTIYVGERMYFYLPPGNWRLSAKGRVSLSAVGEGVAGVKTLRPRDGAVPRPGLISVGGELYDHWPRRWTKYEFGPGVDRGGATDDQSTRASRSTPAPIAVAIRKAPVVRDEVEVKPAIKIDKPAGVDADENGGKEDASEPSIGADKGWSVLQLRRSAAE